MNPDKRDKIDALLSEAAEIIKSAADREIPELLGDGVMQTFIESIAAPKANKTQTIYDYLLENKHSLQLLALIRLVIHRNYSIKGKVGHTDVFVSPNHMQWYDDGVMFFQGPENFAGLIGLYQDGRVKFGIANRDIRGGEGVGPEAIDFIDSEEMKNRSNQPSIPKNIEDLDTAIAELEELLRTNETRESIYQDFLRNHPWVFGAQYNRVDSHQSFDDRNIPDYTAVRVRDASRDIIEIKPPFLSLFAEDNTFRAEFNNAWNQVEKYLDFARNEADYLRRQKGLFFDNPKCYLLAGFSLSAPQIEELRRKERMNHAITIITYDDLLTMAKSTVAFVKALKE